jgi:hypothetical protein
VPFATVADYPAIRAALDITLTAAKLPDEVIASAPYHPAAEAEVTRRLGDLADDAVGQTAAVRAVVLLTAARLLPALPNITQRRLGDSSVSLQPMAMDRRLRELRAMAAQELAALRAQLDPNAPAAVPTVFTVAPGGRVQRDAIPIGEGA